MKNLTRGAVEKRFKVVEEHVEDVREKATGTFGKLEGVFDQRVSAALSRLGIPTQKQVEVLTARIDKLEAQLKKLKK